MLTPVKLLVGIFCVAGFVLAGDMASTAAMLPASAGSAETKASLEKDPVCGMKVDPKSSDTLKSQYKGKTYYFCGSMCKKNFDANPEKYIGKTTAAKVTKAKDLVCGMDVKVTADTPKSDYKGKTYYFCSKFCKKSFDASPEEYK